MASNVRISAPVGTRNGRTVMTNREADLAQITALFDRIPFASGGTREVGGLWATERSRLIAEVTAEIVRFQTLNGRPVIDGVIDPGGGTLKLMNQLAVDTPAGPVAAEVVPAPDGLPEQMSHGVFVADVTSMTGSGPLKKAVVGAEYVRKLVRVEGSSIRWFGVVIPSSATPATGAIPHINFTPTPIQGGYADGSYESFSGWGGLWRDYTSVIGGQLAASGANQVLVIPFYRTAQQRNLGEFLANWQEVVGAVVTAALNAVDASNIGNSFAFRRIVSSSFSNGWVAHQNFHNQAVGAAGMTDALFDLDGVAGGSSWQPTMGTIYQNRAAGRVNPLGNVWYVGGRWSEFRTAYPGGINTHAACRNHLLYHGLWLKCT